MELTAQHAAQLALQAYAAGTLSAQAPVPAASYYTQQDGQTYRCAIGQCFSPQEARRLQIPTPGTDYKLVRQLIRDGEIITDDPEQLKNLQILHDNWCSSQDDAGRQNFLNYARELAQ